MWGAWRAERARGLRDPPGSSAWLELATAVGEESGDRAAAGHEGLCTQGDGVDPDKARVGGEEVSAGARMSGSGVLERAIAEIIWN